LVLSPPRDRPIAWSSSPLFFGPGGVRVGPHHGRVDQQAFQVGVVAEGLHHPGPDPGLGPAVEPPEGIVPVAEAGREVAPGGASAGDPEHGVDEQAVVLGGRPRVAGLAGQEVLDAAELLVGHLEAAHGESLPAWDEADLSPPDYLD
jgi:hypothetical protein